MSARSMSSTGTCLGLALDIAHEGRALHMAISLHGIEKGAVILPLLSQVANEQLHLTGQAFLTLAAARNRQHSMPDRMHPVCILAFLLQTDLPLILKFSGGVARLRTAGCCSGGGAELTFRAEASNESCSPPSSRGVSILRSFSTATLASLAMSSVGRSPCSTQAACR